MTVTEIVIAVIAIVTEKRSVTRIVTVIGTVTVNVKEKESRKNRTVNTHSTTTTTRWTTIIWRWWIETRSVNSLLSHQDNPLALFDDVIYVAYCASQGIDVVRRRWF